VTEIEEDEGETEKLTSDIWLEGKEIELLEETEILTELEDLV